MKVKYDRDRMVLGIKRDAGEVTEVPDYVAAEHIAEGIAVGADAPPRETKKRKGGDE